MNLFKNFGKGILYILAIPAFVAGLAVFGVAGLLIFIFQTFKNIILFFTGRPLNGKVKEDIEAEKIMKAMLEPKEDVQIVKAEIADPRQESQPQESPEHQIEMNHFDDFDDSPIDAKIEEIPENHAEIELNTSNIEPNSNSTNNEEEKEQEEEIYTPKSSNF